MNRNSDNPLLYQLLMASGLLALIGWFALMRQVGFMSWLTSLGPDSHIGALNLVAIMLWMLPALLIWKYYLRWINRRLRVRGIYYEDSYYGNNAQNHSSGPECPDDTTDQPRGGAPQHKGPEHDS
ncbi:hypothetical protein [Motiliproteus sediminis]|uniref:hypothetical protein n=1 Tax=Motiliproteus sediminis TaxID=1468178 RepID=UPI001AEFDAC1|nr:hypothetical protein [Motiliproteus sediminis]